MLARSPSLTRRTVVLGGVATMASRGISAAQSTTPSPGATPGAGSNPASASIARALGLVPPAFLDVADPNALRFTWADVARQFAVAGIDDPFDEGVDLVSITQPLALFDPFSTRALDPTLRTAIGFSPLEAEQVVTIGVEPERTVIYIGIDHTDTVINALGKQGYTRVNADAETYWTRGDTIDLQSGFSQYTVSSSVNYLVVRDATLIFTSSKERANAILESDVTAAVEPTWSPALKSVPAESISMVGLPGDGLNVAAIVPEGAVNPDLLAESDDAVGPMPVPGFALFGATVGFGANVEGTPAAEGVPMSRLVSSIQFSSPEEASTATDVTIWRLEHMVSGLSGVEYADLFRSPAPIGGAIERGVAGVTAEQRNAGAWLQMVGGLDLLPFAWA